MATENKVYVVSFWKNAKKHTRLFKVIITDDPTKVVPEDASNLDGKYSTNIGLIINIAYSEAGKLNQNSFTVIESNKIAKFVKTDDKSNDKTDKKSE